MNATRTFRCPHCSSPFTIAASLPAGQLVGCPTCKKGITVPAVPAPVVTAPVTAVPVAAVPVAAHPPVVAHPTPVLKKVDDILDVVPVVQVHTVKPIDEKSAPLLSATSHKASPPPTARQVVPIDRVPSLQSEIPTVVPANAKVVMPVAVEKGVVPLPDKPHPRPNHQTQPRFTNVPTIAPRRPPTNRAVIVSAIIAWLAALGWLASFLGLANLSPATSLVGMGALMFLSAIFGGLCASAMTGVANFRHSLYAGLWSSGVLFFFVIPICFLLVGWYAALHYLSSSLPGEDAVSAFRRLAQNLSIASFCFLLSTPFLIVTGFLLGGGFDVLLTAAGRTLGSRERWTYHTRDGKSFPVYGPWRNPILGHAWNVLGWTILLTCWIPLLSMNLLGALSAFALGQVCRTLAKKYRAVSAKAALETDQRAPIVYLRSFQDDGLFNPGTFFLLNDWLRTLAEKTAEDNLSTKLAPFGPVVAIGRPDEEMPEVGAARIYVDDAHWQDLITDLLAVRGALAVLQAGKTKGLRWELEKVSAMLPAEQILMFIPFSMNWSNSRRQADYGAFRAWANTCFPAELPVRIEGDQYFFYFTSKPSWKSHVIEANATIPATHPLKALLTDLKANTGFRRWRLINPGRLLKLMLAGILVMTMSCCVRGVWNLVEHQFSPSTTQQPSETDAPPKRRQAQEAPPVVPPQGIVHNGKLFRYRLTLGPEWRPQPNDNPKCDLAVVRGGDIYLRVLAGKDQRNFESAAEGVVKQLTAAEGAGGKMTFDAVTLRSSSKLMVKGKEWVDFKIELQQQKTTIWQHYRCYSSPEGHLILLVQLSTDDPETNQLVAEAMDAVEILPPP